MRARIFLKLRHKNQYWDWLDFFLIMHREICQQEDCWNFLLYHQPIIWFTIHLRKSTKSGNQLEWSKWPGLVWTTYIDSQWCLYFNQSILEPIASNYIGNVSIHIDWIVFFNNSNMKFSSFVAGSTMDFEIINMNVDSVYGCWNPAKSTNCITNGLSVGWIGEIHPTEPVFMVQAKEFLLHRHSILPLRLKIKQFQFLQPI